MGSSTRMLLEGLPAPLAFPDLEEALWTAARLDRFYIPTRYPNGLPGLTPDEAFFRDDADSAVAMAESLLATIRRWAEELTDGRPLSPKEGGAG